MTRLQTIENKLTEINPTVFQELCDSILIRTNLNYKSISRSGSVTGKQKTKKGTPDTLILLPNGKYLMIEYSTDISSGFKKLKDDILKNLDAGKTQIKKEQIKEIVVCFNFNINNKQIEELKQIVFKEGISLDVWKLNRLAIEINLHHSDLANRYLGLPLDTGQIVSLDKFVEEYNKASQGIAAPLNNKFLHRENELKEINEKLELSDIIIITGSPGVGKTKLALQAINNFLSENPTFNAYALSYKHFKLYEDLYSHLSLNQNYILLVDDANRIDEIQQIIGFYNASRKGKLKIILTVRDYALKDILIHTTTLKKEIIQLEKLTDEQITDTIKEQPFEILNPRYQKEILRIADGNPRIAIMASLLAKEKQNLSALSDVSDLFERYFSTFIRDKSNFENEINIKVLGLIAFFYALPYKNKELLSGILIDFDIDFTQFNETIERLDKLELVEIQYDYVKIPEQNLATFFFYKSFIKDNLLSFETLLQKYFEKNKDRFRDTIIPSNNTFGAEKVMNKLKPYLKEYFKSIENNLEKSINFLSYFWFYLQDETILFLFNYISNLPLSQNQNYKTNYETNDFAYDKNSFIELSGNLFRVPDRTKEILELAIELIKKRPELLPELIHKIREVLTFDVEDERYNFIRQTTLFDTLIEGIENGDELFAVIFFELSKSFIKNKFQQFKSERNNAFVHYQYPIPNNKVIQNFRRKIWVTTDKYFQQYPEYAFDFIKEFSKMYPDVINDIMEFDIPYVVEIINNNLDPKNFHHCKYVHDQIWWFKRHNFDYPVFSELKRKFSNKTYQRFLKLDWNRLKDKEIYNFDNYQEYDKLKEKELRDFFRFEDLNDFLDFLEELEIFYPYFKDSFNTNRIINILVDEICKNDFELCLSVLNNLKNNKYFISPYIIFNNNLNSEENIIAFWQLIQESDFDKKIEWEQAFFEVLGDNFITKKWGEELLESLKRNKKQSMIFFHRFDKYLNAFPELFQEILILTTERNNNNNNNIIRFWTEEVFTKYFDKLGDNIHVIKKAYKQQFLMQQHFDIENKGLINILKIEPSFLVELVGELYEHEELKSLSGSHLNFSQIWEIDNIEKHLKMVIEISIKNDLFFCIQEHFINAFFKNTKKELIEKSNNFITKYIKENHSDPNKMLVIFDVIKHNRQDLLEEMLLLYITLNQDLEDFKKINIVHHGGIYHGDVIISDIIAGKWREILEIVNKSKLGMELIPIKTYIKEIIDFELENGNRERQRRFISKF